MAPPTAKRLRCLAPASVPAQPSVPVFLPRVEAVGPRQCQQYRLTSAPVVDGPVCLDQPAPGQTVTLCLSVARNPDDPCNPHSGRPLVSVLVRPGPRGPKGRTLIFSQAQPGTQQPLDQGTTCLVGAWQMAAMEEAVRTAAGWCVCYQGVFLPGTPLTVIDEHLALGPVPLCPLDMSGRVMLQLVRLGRDDDPFFVQRVYGGAAADCWQAALTCWGEEYLPVRVDGADVPFLNLLRLQEQQQHIPDQLGCVMCWGPLQGDRPPLVKRNPLAMEMSLWPEARLCEVNLGEGPQAKLLSSCHYRPAACLNCGGRALRVARGDGGPLVAGQHLFSLRLLIALLADLQNLEDSQWLMRANDLVWTRCRRVRLDRRWVLLDLQHLVPLSCCCRALQRIITLLEMGAVAAADTLVMRFFVPAVPSAPWVGQTPAEAQVVVYARTRLIEYGRVRRAAKRLRCSAHLVRSATT